MVEGHSVHRVAARHRQRLLGRAFQATSPNGKFSQGAQAIHEKIFYRIEAIGKNLFCFFGNDTDKQDVVVMHVHFGMAGNWAIYGPNNDVNGEEVVVPEPTKTNRLRLYHPVEKITADLSAMTVNYGGVELYETKRAKLGQDPLRSDADPNLLWTRIKKTNKSIGALIMDQSYFTGPGNIYRAEILFKAGVHPDIPGKELEREEFDRIWYHTVDLLQRGFQTGSILTVDADEAKKLGVPKLRRYIYNSSHCPRCRTRIKTWDIASRTCYACPKCQPRHRTAVVATATPPTTKQKDAVPQKSRFARQSAAVRSAASGRLGRLTVKEIKQELAALGVTRIPSGKKANLVKLLEEALAEQPGGGATTVDVTAADHEKKLKTLIMLVSSEDAAKEKAEASESLAVEHNAELAPAQARRARSKVTPESAFATTEPCSPRFGRRKRRRRIP